MSELLTPQAEVLDENTFLERIGKVTHKRLVERFENVSGKEKLPYHDSLHTQRVTQRVQTFLAALKKVAPDAITPQVERQAYVAARGHDLVQNWHEKVVTDEFEYNGKKYSFNKIIRDRTAPSEEERNEHLSALEVAEILDTMSWATKQGIFTQTDTKVVKNAIENGTYADFDGNHVTVYQPQAFTPDAPIVTRVLALADTGAAGMGPGGEYEAEGLAFFREENLDIFEALQQHFSGEKPLNEVQKAYFTKRMRGWLGFQVLFAKGRKALTHNEIETFAEAMRPVLHEAFSKFDENIARAESNVKKYENASFEELRDFFGYTPEGVA